MVGVVVLASWHWAKQHPSPSPAQVAAAQATQWLEAQAMLRDLEAADAAVARQARQAAEARQQAEERRRQEEARRQALMAHAVAEGERWTNSLGLVFSPLPGGPALCCVWETRLRDFEVFVEATHRDMGNAMYCVGANGRWNWHEGFHWRNPGLRFQQASNHPVVGVSWLDARAFCAWLTQTERASGRLAARQAYRLPTDLEWSRLAGLEAESGGTPKERDGKIKEVYPWGTQWPPPRGAGNFFDETAHRKYLSPTFVADYDDRFAETAPVGSFAPNRHGLYDLSGNVWEWCEDYLEGHEGPHVLRGASWEDGEPALLLASNRGSLTAERRCNFVGFRLVLELPAP